MGCNRDNGGLLGFSPQNLPQKRCKIGGDNLRAVKRGGTIIGLRRNNGRFLDFALRNYHPRICKILR